MPMAANNMIISINTTMTIKMFATNNRIIIKESFASKFLTFTLTFNFLHLLLPDLIMKLLLGAQFRE